MSPMGFAVPSAKARYAIICNVSTLGTAVNASVFLLTCDADLRLMHCLMCCK